MQERADSMFAKALEAVCALNKQLVNRDDIRRAVNQVATNKDQCTHLIQELHKRGYLESTVLVTEKARKRHLRTETA